MFKIPHKVLSRTSERLIIQWGIIQNCYFDYEIADIFPVKTANQSMLLIDTDISGNSRITSGSIHLGVVSLYGSEHSRLPPYDVQQNQS